MTTLLISSRNTEDNQQLWRAAVQRGWSVERARGIRIPDITDADVAIYIESLFAPTIAKNLGLELLQTTESWLATLPYEYRLRDVALSTLGEVRDRTFPAFVKPPNEKSFPARVYPSPDSLPTDYDLGTLVLYAAPVEWTVEFRCFCLDGRVRTASPYLRNGQLSQLDGFSASAEEHSAAIELAEQILHDGRVQVPRAIVLDVGQITNAGWAIVEANAAWGSGIYNCDPDEVLNVVQNAVTREYATND